MVSVSFPFFSVFLQTKFVTITSTHHQFFGEMCELSRSLFSSLGHASLEHCHFLDTLLEKDTVCIFWSLLNSLECKPEKISGFKLMTSVHLNLCSVSLLILIFDNSTPLQFPGLAVLLQSVNYSLLEISSGILISITFPLWKLNSMSSFHLYNVSVSESVVICNGKC